MVAPRWDVVVAGAGPAGSVAAWVLARAGRRVLLVDDAGRASRTVGESLPGAARPLLRDLGLLPVVEQGPHLPSYGNLSAWGTDELAATDFIRSPQGPGWHLDRAAFDRDLREAAQSAGAASRESRVLVAAPEGDGWQVQLHDEAVAARWLIDATGRRAALARNLGATRQRDAPLVALYAWIAPQRHDGDSRTLVEAVPDGWWYTALLPDGSRVVALHVDAEDAAAILHPPEGWLARLESTIHVRRVVAPPFISAPRGVEACGARLDRFGAAGWLAAGDAALSFDPLSSQGIFNALYTGMRAGETAHAALSGQGDAVAAYADRLEQIRAAYLRHHWLFYQAEQRWPDRPFWLRRARSQPAQSVT